MQQDARQALEFLIRESDDGYEEPEAFIKGSIIRVLRPIRVTPRMDGKFDGGEDSPLSRRGPRPRGSTATILKPGTWCEVLKDGRTTSEVCPYDEEGEKLVDPISGQTIESVVVNINKFNTGRGDAYKAGKPKPLTPPTSPVRPATGAQTPAGKGFVPSPEQEDPFQELEAAKADYAKVVSL